MHISIVIVFSQMQERHMLWLRVEKFSEKDQGYVTEI